MALRAIRYMPKPRSGTTTTKVSASGPPITKAMTMAKRNMSGARMAVRMSIMYANCTF